MNAMQITTTNSTLLKDSVSCYAVYNSTDISWSQLILIYRKYEAPG